MAMTGSSGSDNTSCNPGARRDRAARRAMQFAMLATLACTTIACRSEMYDQPRAEPLEQSLVFADSLSSRPLIEGTVARGTKTISVSEATGHTDKARGADTTAIVTRDTGANVAASSNAAPGPERRATAAEIRAMSIPGKVTRQMLDRGHERFDIYCSPCHGRTGDGNGMIVQRGFPPPPSFHIERLRAVADGHIYDVITNGFGVMYNYANRVKPEDRWAIAAYIRALQLSRSPDVPMRKAQSDK